MNDDRAKGMRVLVLHAHPAPRRSRVNAALLAAARGVEGVTVRELYEEYPDFFIDVKAEQEVVAAHDVVVMQHPFYWYSTPSLVKEWFDEVLTSGWAYGEGGTALRGKRWMHAVSTGGTAESYGPGSEHGFTVRQLMAPLEATARLCGMEYLAPFLVQGAGRLSGAEIGEWAGRYAARLAGLRDGDGEPGGGLTRLCITSIFSMRPWCIWRRR